MELNEEVVARAAARCRERHVVLPTFAQLKDPALIPAEIKERLRHVGLWDINPLNLFRIGWHNEPVEHGGGFGPVNYLALPEALTGVAAPIVLLVGKWFPTGAHKVGAAYGCLAPRLVTGGFDPTRQKAVWPSTGNYCRGGVFDACVMGCSSVAILPEQMSRERFEWLRALGAEIIATPGGESNVKEIYDKCWEIRRTRPECVIFNQFEEFGNACWHYHVTGAAAEEAWRLAGGATTRLSAFVAATGSAGTIAAGDYLRSVAPRLLVVAAEALQCPTLYENGFGEHRIEGIGDKHVPWIHNVRTTDVVVAVDDAACLRLFRLFNEEVGQAYLVRAGVAEAVVRQLPLCGISAIANMLAAIKVARRFEFTARDVVLSVATDSAAMYGSRLEELRAARGEYTPEQAARDFEGALLATRDDHVAELSYSGRKRLHNLKYYTWVEQQGKSVAELNALWYDEEFWARTFAQVEVWDRWISAFNIQSGATPC
ncbi:MAG: pyridoxal-phosphate dependent enzyme [bacterium]|nr:pyridoxal-phosphate dependent enzyme [bacterium]